jgi:hypothetical protein
MPDIGVSRRPTRLMLRLWRTARSAKSNRCTPVNFLALSYTLFRNKGTSEETVVLTLLRYETICVCQTEKTPIQLILMEINNLRNIPCTSKKP